MINKIAVKANASLQPLWLTNNTANKAVVLWMINMTANKADTSPRPLWKSRALWMIMVNASGEVSVYVGQDRY